MGRPLKWQSSPLMQNIVSRNRTQPEVLHWLDLQKAERYAWRQADGRKFYRRMGVVESLFDSDGQYWCGRADLHQNVRFEIKTTLSNAELQHRIVIAWTLMRHSHALLSCKAVQLHDVTNVERSEKWTNKCFVYEWPSSTAEAVEQTRCQVVFVGDAYPDLDTEDFFKHVMNTGRAINSNESLSRLYVMPFQRTMKDTLKLHFVPILAHQITDGLTTYRWNNHFSEIMNMDSAELEKNIEQLLGSQKDTLNRLPPAQEALYPAVSKNKARERWYWLLTRIMRHVKTPPPAAFQNPLRREHILTEATKFPPVYKKVLDYEQTPPLNAANVSADLFGRPVHNMRRLCKEAGISIGSGSFTLVAMVMMQLEENRSPEIILSERLPFVGSFPVNPRPFFSGAPTTGSEDSCMLAFSDGVTLPFLPCHLDLVGRFRLLGRLAHKQLRQYQKKKRSVEEEVHLGSKSPSQLIPALFCSTLERMEGRSAKSKKAGVTVQGSLNAKASSSLATCGISSVGDISAFLKSPKVDLQRPSDKDLIAEFTSMGSTVRPRDGEFLVGAVGTATHLGFGAAYDANAIDPDRAKEWKYLMESLLDRELFHEVQAKL